MAFNFVKFQRGSATAYENLKNRNGLESDALYFIYDKTAPEEGGLLYLGDVLIGGSGLNNTTVTSLNDLSDVNTAGVTMADGMILQYNITTGKYTPVSIKTAVENSGANTTLPIVDSITLQGNQTASQALALSYNNPTEGDIVFVSGNPYIYNGSSWQELVSSSIEDRLALIENSLSSVDTRIMSAVAGANHLTYEVVNSLPEITVSNVGSLTNKVLLVPSSGGTATNNYDEYMVVNNNYEKLGTWGADLSNYVQVGTLDNYVTTSALSAVQSSISNTYLPITQYQAEVGSITTLRNKVNSTTATVISEITNIYDRLEWHDLT